MGPQQQSLGRQERRASLGSAGRCSGRPQLQAPRHARQHAAAAAGADAPPPPPSGRLLQSRVELRNQRGEQLVATLVEPPPPPVQAAAAAPGVVLLAHGYMSSRDSELLVRLSAALARGARLASLRLDFSGNGESEGRFRYGNYLSEAEELGCAKRHLEACLGRHVVGMLGHSKGATDVLLHAGTPALTQQFGPVPAVVSLAARCNVRHGVVERLGPAVLEQLRREGQVEMRGRSRAGPFTWLLTSADLEDRLATDVAAAAAAIPGSTSVLTVHGDADADVPLSEARALDGLIKNHRLLVLEGADHCFSSGAAFYELASEVVAFFAQHAVAE